MSGERITVAVIDDQELVRLGLRTLIGSEAGLELVGEAADGREGLRLIRSTRPRVVLCDIRMPDVDGLELLREVNADPSLAAVRVVMLTTFELDEYVFEALRHGASGFLLKDAEPDFLLAAIRTVHAGSAVIAPGATAALFEHLSPAPAAPAAPPAFGTLTERERQIFALAARGMSNSEIAAHEFVSEATVKTHLSRVLAKLALRDRVQLVVYAYEHGIV